MEKVQTSSISINNTGSQMSEWKCGLYTSCKGPFAIIKDLAEKNKVSTHKTYN